MNRCSYFYYSPSCLSASSVVPFGFFHYRYRFFFSTFRKLPLFFEFEWVFSTTVRQRKCELMMKVMSFYLNQLTFEQCVCVSLLILIKPFTISEFFFSLACTSQLPASLKVSTLSGTLPQILAKRKNK